MAAPLSPIEESTTANPPRFRWLIRLSVAYAMLILAMTGAWFAWDRVAQRRVNDEIARLRGLGQRVLPEDFNNHPAVAPGDNAASVYLAASNFTLTKGQDDFTNNVDWSVRLTASELAVLRSIPHDCAANLLQVRSARKLNQADWGRVYNSPLINVMLPSLSPDRELANLVRCDARLSHLDGNDSAAVESIRDELHFAAMIDGPSFTIIEHLVATRISALGTELAVDFANDLKIGPAPAASREQVMELIRELLDTPLDTALAEGLRGEQAMQLDLVQSQPALASMFGVTLIGPAVRLSAVHSTQQMSRRIAAIDLENFSKSTSVKGVQNINSDLTPITQANRVFEQLFGSASNKYIETHFRHKTERRAAGVMLAMRLYEIDHAGAIPASLDELVPKYLPAVPVDPFSNDKRPMSYVREMTVDGVATPVIYSVGRNGVDDHASVLYDPSAGRHNSNETVHGQPWDRQDIVFPLVRLPLTEPTTKPADGDSE